MHHDHGSKHISVGMQLNEMLEEKVGPYMKSIDNAALSRPIILQNSQDQNRKVSFYPLYSHLYSSHTH